MTSTLLSPSHITAPVRRRCFTGSGGAPPTAIVSAAFARQNAAHSMSNHRFDRTQGDQNQRRGARLADVAVRNREIKSNTRAKSPETDTTAGAQLPAVSSPEAFRTPASAHLITPVPGRRPKTLNASSHCAGAR